MKKLLALGAAVIALFATTPNTYATWGPPLFNLGVTNVIYGVGTGSNLVGWPVTQTNGTIGPTGLGQSLAGCDHIGLNVQGLMVAPTFAAGTNGTVTVVLCWSMANNQPQLTLASNAWSNSQIVTNQNDWCNTNFMQTIVFTPPAGVQTNFVNYMTNIDVPSQAADASWVGVYTISNLLGNTGFITNFSVQVTGKQPVRPLSN